MTNPNTTDCLQPGDIKAPVPALAAGLEVAVVWAAVAVTVITFCVGEETEEETVVVVDATTVCVTTNILCGMGADAAVPGGLDAFTAVG